MKLKKRFNSINWCKMFLSKSTSKKKNNSTDFEFA